MTTMTLSDFRKVAPEAFLKKFQTLWTSQKKELKVLLGTPPDIKRVKPTQWIKWQKDQEAVLLILMVGYASTVLNSQLDDLDEIDDLYEHEGGVPQRNRQPGDDNAPSRPDGIDRRRVEREFLRDVRSRARFATQRMRQTTESRLRRQLDVDTGSETEDVGGFNPDALFSRSRAEMVVRTEMTAARSASTRAIHASLTAQGIECHLVWKMRPCNHCEVCPLLDGTPDSFWSRFTNGPPLHPHCCCELRILFGTRAALIRSGHMSRNPSVAGLRAAIQRHGFKV